MAIMYLSIENFTCPIVQISLYFSVLKQFTLSKTVWNHPDINSLVNSVAPDQLIRIHTVFNATCELIIINQNMEFNILFTLYKFCTCPMTSKLKFSTCPEWNGTRLDKSGMVFPQPCPCCWDSRYRRIDGPYDPRLLDCPKKNFLVRQKLNILTITFLFLNNSMKPVINCLVNCVDRDQLASEEVSWSGSTLFSMQHVNW